MTNRDVQKDMVTRILRKLALLDDADKIKVLNFVSHLLESENQCIQQPAPAYPRKAV